MLMKDYNYHVRPVKNPYDTLQVSVTFSLIEVISVDENDGHLSVKAWLSMVGISVKGISKVGISVNSLV